MKKGVLFSDTQTHIYMVGDKFRVSAGIKCLIAILNLD